MIRHSFRTRIALLSTGLSGLVLVPNIALVAGTVGETPDPHGWVEKIA